jgi:hypothetical protein
LPASLSDDSRKEALVLLKTIGTTNWQQKFVATILSLCFSGAKIISALTTDSISWGTYYQFCYVDASNCIQGRSRPFQLESDSEPNTGIQLPSLENFTFLGCNDDFVEVGEEEDGEIVVIKPRSAVLMEELHRITSSANDKAVSTIVLLSHTLPVLVTE